MMGRSWILSPFHKALTYYSQIEAYYSRSPNLSYTLELYNTGIMN